MKKTGRMNRRIACVVALCAMTLFLGACLDEHGPPPTGQDVTHAVRALVIADNAPPDSQRSPHGAAAAAPRVTVKSVRNLGCNPAPDYKGFLCGTVIDLVRPSTGEQTLTRLVRLVRTKAGWKATMQ